ncbi:MAG: phenylalanine--tRNA ligase subunit beta [bacterium]|nr:phenylalanine--tRNA ligase subunit beta [bacterium]
MKIPLSWLRAFVEIDIPAELLAEKLTAAGLEVAKIEYLGVPQTQVEGLRYPQSEHLVWDRSKLLLGAIREVKPHPNADRLVMAMVDYGAGEPEQCVTGAPNLFAYKGQVLEKPLYTVIALEGAEVWDGHSDEPKRMILKEKPLRGVPNRSMVCSEKELGMSESHDGIILLHDDPGFAPGTPAQDVFGDVIFEIELTPNLARCYSVYGVAREIAALLDKPLRPISYDVLQAGAPIDDAIRVTIQDARTNARFTVMLLRDVTIQPSPEWIQRRLMLVGQRPINNIVDITNYVMFEMGQPLHAFDYDQLVARAGGAVPHLQTRLARAGETLKTLDGAVRTLTPQDIVITDNQDVAISLSAVMGGFDTEISDGTKNVLLEAANWDFISVRRTTHAHKLFSEAGTRFSRGVHPSQAEWGVKRGIELMRQTSGGTVAAGIVDVYPVPAPVITIDLPEAEIRRIMGMNFTAENAAALLRRAAFTVEVAGAVLHVTVPDYRLDIGTGVVGQADLIEEIARINGFDHIPITIIDDIMPPQRPNPALTLEEKTRDLLTQLGMRETISYRMTTPEAEAKLTPPGALSSLPGAGYVTLANPITLDKTVMRHTLLVSLIENARANARYALRQQVFEIGSVYLPVAGELLPAEPRRLAILISGARHIGGGWMGAESDANVDFYDLKGVIEHLLAGLHIDDARFVRGTHTSFHPGRSADLHIGGQSVGTLGEVHPLVARAFGWDGAPILAAEFDLDALLRAATPLFRVTPLPVTPPVLQDIALVVNETVGAADIERVIRQAGGDLLKGVRLFDVYTGDPIPDGQKSLAYNLVYQTDDRTLTDKEVSSVHARIVKAVERELGAKLRG